MKTSTLLATMAVLCCFGGILASNLTLKNEYEKGNLQDPFELTPVGNFRYIKDNTDTSRLRQARFEIQVDATQPSAIGLYKNLEPGFLFKVVNDTLYISSDPQATAFANWQPVMIHAKELSSITLSNGEYSLRMKESDSFSIRMDHYASLRLSATAIRSLSVLASGQSALSLTVQQPIERYDLGLEDLASLTANSLDIKNRNIHLGPFTSLKLIGRSMHSFGVMSTTR